METVGEFGGEEGGGNQHVISTNISALQSGVLQGYPLPPDI